MVDGIKYLIDCEKNARARLEAASQGRADVELQAARDAEAMLRKERAEEEERLREYKEEVERELEGLKAALERKYEQWAAALEELDTHDVARQLTESITAANK